MQVFYSPTQLWDVLDLDCNYLLNWLGISNVHLFITRLIWAGFFALFLMYSIIGLYNINLFSSNEINYLQHTKVKDFII